MSERRTAKLPYEQPALIIEGRVADLTAGIDVAANDEFLGGAVGSQ